MIKPFKNRFVNYARPVSVYYNLHQSCWSIKQGGVVVGHADKLLMVSEKFKVSQAGRDKVLSTGVKNVHAFIVGFISPHVTTLEKTIEGERISYNPVYAGHFYRVQNGYKVPVASDAKLRLMLTDSRQVLLMENQPQQSNFYTVEK